ncbi:MAG: AzlD domain-containing protein [Treponema sp.]|nr:AzlD domain-containing protein [Treponema sp.]
MNKATISFALLATFFSSLVIFLTRAFPFIIFSNNKLPKSIQFIEKYIPPMIMAILVVYCFKGSSFLEKPWGIPEILSSLVAVVLHLWKRNPMASIFGSTALYIFLNQIF